MIDRYTLPEMGEIWTQEARFGRMLVVETAVATAQAELGLIPKKAALDIRRLGKFSVARIIDIEKTTKHDVIAFVSSVAENVGPMGRYVHFGLTSSDVLDTALALLLRDAGEVLLTAVAKLRETLQRRSQETAELLSAGRTHGMHAEPTSFGMKLAGYWAETARNEERLVRALKQAAVGKLSGAVGTYSTQTHLVEKRVCELLGISTETIATQVVPRDRHAEVLWAIGMIGAGLERLAVELRHLQRTEVGEAIEGFTKGQKGSSAMPHKKNPISAENITGCARLLRAYTQAAMEDIALWHERDISHSAVERVIFPDAFILAHYAVDRMAKLIDGLDVQKDRLLQNMRISGGQLFSSHFLLALVDKGLSREEAYALVQRLSHTLGADGQLLDAALADRDVRARLSDREIRAVFSGDRHRAAIRGTLKRAGIWNKAKPAKAAPGNKTQKSSRPSLSRSVHGNS